MRWSKLKKMVEQRMAPSVRARIAFNSTRYGACSCGTAWITIDKKLIANLCTRAYYNKLLNRLTEFGLEMVQEDYAHQCVDYGEFSRQDFYAACWDFIHNLTIDQALECDNPLIQSLAVIDSRLGKRRLIAINPEPLHPLTRTLLAIRLEAESLQSNYPPETWQ